MKPKGIYNRGFLLRSPLYFRVRIDVPLNNPAPPRVALNSNPLVPAANQVFSPEELKQRIKDHQDRIKKNQPKKENLVLCAGCGVIPSKLTCVSYIPGWVVEKLPGFGCQPVKLIWCPTCVRIEQESNRDA